MPQYLMIAEKVYKKIKEDDLFSDTPTEHLNNLIGVIRKEIKGTKFKLKYNFIDFDEYLTKPLDECAVKIDISLMPSHKNKDEYILWLAGFIERMTTGGKPIFHLSQNLFRPILSLIANLTTLRHQQNLHIQMMKVN